MKDIVISIITYGKNSPLLNDFINICVNLSLTTINLSKYKDYILSKTGLTARDLAFDAVADLFKDTEEHYQYINCQFENLISNLEDTPEEIFKARMSALIISRTKQRITEIREEFGEIYFKIKRAVYLHIKRHNNIFKSFIYNECTYIYTCPEKELNLNKQEITDELIIDILNSTNHSKYSVTKIINFIFENLNRRNDYIKAVIDTKLYNITAEFYKLRMSDFIFDTDYVHYYNNKEEM
jgi:hypothetical protein